MKSIGPVRVPAILASLLLLAGVCSAAQAGRNLIINGRIATSDVKVIGGKTYVPLSDVASALGMTLVNKPGSIEMTTAGGAGPVKGQQGKIGELIFTGKWRFMPVRLDQMDSYTEKYTGDGKTVTPRANGETLFVLSCHLKNGQKDSREMIMSCLHCGHTALTDDQEHGYPPCSYDVHNETGAYGGPRLLPGAAADFAVIFSAPKGTNPKDLIFTIMCGNDFPTGTDVRISAK
jgi:hypothetical protein